MNTVAMLRNEKDLLDVPAGNVIFHQGDPGDAMYVVIEGIVDIVLGDRVLETIEDGGIFGEMALIDGQTRSADAVARTDVKLARVNEERFLFLAKYNPYFTLDVLRVTSRDCENKSRRAKRSNADWLRDPYRTCYEQGGQSKQETLNKSTANCFAVLSHSSV